MGTLGQRHGWIQEYTMIEDFINMLIIVGFTTAGIAAGYWARGYIENDRNR